MKRRRPKAIDYYITITIVLHRNEEQGVRAHDRQNLTFSWGAVLTKVMSVLKLDTGGGTELVLRCSDLSAHQNHQEDWLKRLLGINPRVSDLQVWSWSKNLHF